MSNAGNYFIKVVNKVHLWIGLMTGLLFFIIALSGAILTWKPEISRMLYNEDIEPQNKHFVSVSQIKLTIAQEFPEADFRTVLFRDSASTANALLYVPGTYYYAFMNPYTGEIVHLQDMKKGWLNIMVPLHRNLMMGQTGRKIVHWVTLLSLFMLISGIILWWPVNKYGRRQAFTLKLGISPKKLNFDLHSVLGFYATWIGIFLVITGLFWGFDFFKNSIKTMTGEEQITYETPVSNSNRLSKTTNLSSRIDSIAVDFREKQKGKFINVAYPHSETDPIHITVIDPESLINNADHYYFDQYSGDGIKGDFQIGLYKDASSFRKINMLVYDIHLGTIGGLPGRILVFIASLILASMPVTGFIIWLGKRKSNKNKQFKEPIAHAPEVHITP